jgi:hypothetical protein
LHSPFFVIDPGLWIPHFLPRPNWRSRQIAPNRADERNSIRTLRNEEKTQPETQLLRLAMAKLFWGDYDILARARARIAVPSINVLQPNPEKRVCAKLPFLLCRS